MKNIHVLPTDKPSRLYLNTQEYIFENEYSLSTDECQNKHIYITSDEKFVIDEYITDGIEVIKATPKLVDAKIANLVNRRDWRKIILTTDQDLIKDGVQAIDDEFLEWFVKNPTCEYVEVSEDYFKPSNMVYGHDTEPYKIIIPKKEPRILTVEAFNKAKISYKEPKQDEIMERFIANAKQQETLEEKLAKIVSKEPSKFWAESDERARIREEKKQHLIDMMRNDEELGLYDEPKQETLEDHNYLQGFINQFEEEGEYQELSNDDWTVSQFLKWMKLNKFKIIKDEK